MPITNTLHAVVLAGGKGTRLRPYTTVLPKPLVPIGDYSVLEIVLRQLAQQGFSSVTLTLGHLASLIQAYIGDGSQWGISIEYAIEDKPLGTMGPVINMLDQLPEDFLVMNGDILTDLNFADLLERHRANTAPMTVATFRRESHIDFGVMDIADELIVGFREKPTLSWTVSMGVYAVSRGTLAAYPAGRAFGFDDLMNALIAKGHFPASHLHQGYWLDIGRPDDYDQANREFSKSRPILLPES